MTSVPTVKTTRLSLSYEDSGSGDPVLLVHGWPDSARGWSGICTGLIEDEHRVVVPELRGFGATRFLQEGAIRDGTAAALARDVLDLADHLGLEQFAVVGHDWGGRAAYALAAFVPSRVTSITSLALPYQPRGEFLMPNFQQARRFWYQWLMYVEAGVDAIGADPIGFARAQWDTWSPAGWFDESEFRATAAAFENPDWAAVSLNAYRSRFLIDEMLDPAYDDVRAAVSASERLGVPTLMIQGGADACDPPEASENLESYFDDYQRVVLPGVGHFPHREAPREVLTHLRRHLARD
jgi:pimeloyl-ACP methyl ester carboxylesterase